MSLSKAPMAPLSMEERALLSNLMRRANLEDSLAGEDTVVSCDSDWNVPSGSSMTDGSKRRCDESPEREPRAYGYTPQIQTGTPMPSLSVEQFGKTKRGTAIVLPEGLDSLAMWGRSVLEFGKFATKGWTYSEMAESQEKEIVSYVKWCRGQVDSAEGLLRDFAMYLWAREYRPNQGFVMNSSVNSVVLKPLQRVVGVLRQHCAEIMKMTFEIPQEAEENFHREVHRGSTLVAEQEVEMLEKVLVKIVHIFETAVLKTRRSNNEEEAMFLDNFAGVEENDKTQAPIMTLHGADNTEDHSAGVSAEMRKHLENRSLNLFEFGFVPIYTEGGGVITPDVIEVQPRVPTQDELDSLSIEQICRLFNAFGHKLTKRGSKPAFLQFVLGEWDGSVEHGLELQRDYSRYTKGTPVVMFWKTPETYYLPFMVHPGEIIPVSFFRQTQVDGNTLTAEMLRSLTKLQIWEVQVNVLRVGASDERDGKAELIRRTVGAWDFQYQHFLEHNLQNLSDEEDEETETEQDEDASTVDGDGTNSIATIQKEADEFSDLDEQEDIPNIEDFVIMTSDEGNETDPIVLNDPSDFINDPYEVKVKEFGGRLLFRLIIQKDTMTVEQFKTSIVQTVQRKAEMKGTEPDKVLTEDDFKLVGDGKTLELDDLLEVNEVFLQLLLKGGGLVRNTYTKQEKLKKLKTKVEAFVQKKLDQSKMDVDVPDKTQEMIASYREKLSSIEYLKGQGNDVLALALHHASTAKLEELALILKKPLKGVGNNVAEDRILQAMLLLDPSAGEINASTQAMQRLEADYGIFYLKTYTELFHVEYGDELRIDLKGFANMIDAEIGSRKRRSTASQGAEGMAQSCTVS
eukprot:s3691_g5.t1